MNNDYRLTFYVRRLAWWFLGVAAIALYWYGSAAWAATTEPIVIGQSLPMGNADDGRSARTVAGAQAYVERVNATGGTRGRSVPLVTLDDGGDPQRHAANLLRLATENKAVAFINCLGDASCTAAAEVSRQLRVPLIGPLSGARKLGRADNPYVFRIRAPYVREAEALARQLLTLGIFNVAIVTDTRPASEAAIAFKEALVRVKLKSGIVSLDAGNEATFSAMVGELGSARYQAVFLDVRTSTFEQLAQRKADGKNDPWPLVVTTFASGAGNSFFSVFTNRMLGFTAVVPNPELSKIPLARELQDHANKAGGGSALTYAGMEGYINTKVCLEALRRAEGKVDANSVFAALNAMGTMDLGGFFANFSTTAASASDWVDIVVRSRTGTLLSFGNGDDADAQQGSYTAALPFFVSRVGP